MSRKKAPQLGIFLGTGDRIRQIRGDLTQSEFGKLFGVKGNTVSRWEDGRLSDDETLKKIADHGRVSVEWLLRGDQATAQLTEHAPDTYDARPRELNLNYLTQALLLSRQFCWDTRPRLPATSEAELASYLYEYWQETGLKPDQVVVKRYAALIKKQED